MTNISNQNIVGLSVVPNDFEELKRYNLAEIFEPTPKEQPKKEVKEVVKEDAKVVEEEGGEKTVEEKAVVADAEVKEEAASKDEAPAKEEGN